MKVICTQENLNRGLLIVSRFVGVRGTLPVLNNILISTDKGRLRLAATDLEIGINTWIGAKVEEEGAITIPSKLIVDFININNDKTITLEVKDKTLYLQSDKYKANIKGIGASEFPLIPEVKEGVEVNIPAIILREAVEQVVFAAAVDETRPVLTGVLLKFLDKELRTVTTDSYRLAERIIKLDKDQKENAIIVPARTMQELARIITNKDEKILLRFSQNQILFLLGDTELISRLIEGNFPSYENIIPKNFKTEVEVNKKDLINAVKIASFFAYDSANNIKLKISSKNLEIKSSSPHLGDDLSVIDAIVDGEEVEIAFNAKFILDVLNVVREEKIILKFSGNLNPGVIASKGSKNYLYILMPIRIE